MKTYLSIRGKFIALNAYIKKCKRSYLNKLIIYLEVLEKQEYTKSKIITQEEIIKFWTEINETKMKNLCEELMK